MRILDNCPACNGDKIQTVFELDEAKKKRFIEFSLLKYNGLLESWLSETPPTVVRCTYCNHHWYRYQPDPDKLFEMYAAGRPINHSNAPTPLNPTIHMQNEMKKLGRLLATNPGVPATLLDYGSGSGRWSRAAIEVGFKVTAYEPSAIRSSSKSAAFEVVHNLKDLTGRKFSVIQLEQVLEHVPNPYEVLCNIRLLCSENCILRISVPNIRREAKKSWEGWPFDGKSPHILAPFEHLHGFTPMSLDKLLARCNLIPLNLRSNIKYYPVNLARSALGVVLPKLGSTLRYAMPGF